LRFLRLFAAGFLSPACRLVRGFVSPFQNAISPQTNMKKTRAIFLVLLLLAAPAAVQAQFTYTTNGAVITLASYTGTGGTVVISNFVNLIGNNAFSGKSTLTNVATGGGRMTLCRQLYGSCRTR